MNVAVPIPALSVRALRAGYPGGGDFQATPARVREIIQLSGPDIYRNATVTREVYTVRATVEQGNSGGPMVDMNGRVLGVVFGAAVDEAFTKQSKFPGTVKIVVESTTFWCVLLLFFSGSLMMTAAAA